MTGPSLMDTGTPGEVIETTPVEDPFAPPAPEPAPALEPVPEREPARVAGVFTVEEWEWFWRAADDTSRGRTHGILARARERGQEIACCAGLIRSTYVRAGV